MRILYFFFVKPWSCTEHTGVQRSHKGSFAAGIVQTVSEMKLLYRWMFLLRISEQGPSTRSKRGRSSFTHFRGPRATTVAARGRLSSSAISPAHRDADAVTRPRPPLQRVHIQPTSQLFGCGTSPFTCLLIDTLHNSVDSTNALHMHNACV